MWQSDFARETLERHFGTKGLKGFGLDGQPLAIIAAGAALHYVGTTKHDRLGHIASLGRVEWGSNVAMDGFTIRNLELLAPTHPEGVALVDILDRSATPMGARMLRRWIAQPLCDTERVTRRHDAVAAFLEQPEMRADLIAELNRIGDLERLLAKTAAVRISPAELDRLRRALTAVEALRLMVDSSDDPVIGRWAGRLDPADAALAQLRTELTEDPPGVLGKGATIASGVVQELDELRDLRDNGKAKLEGIRQREAEATGITSLKIAFNNVFGYYLEVRHAHKDKVPEDWIRKQTLTQAERYITPELKELEQRILGAEERLDVVEREAYSALVTALHPHLPLLQSTARAVAGLDLLLGFAEVAEDHGYHPARPGGPRTRDRRRSPSGHRAVPARRGSYVANDVALDRDHQQILYDHRTRTCPESALLRQTALIALMAQMGSYVPPARCGWGCRQGLHPRGRLGQPQCRRIDLHGGDERNRVHPPQPVRPLARPARRDRPGHQHLRRHQHRLGHRRVPARAPEVPGQDAVRHALPRTQPHGGPVPPDPQRQRQRAPTGRQSPLPAQAGARRQRAQLRHPRRHCGPGLVRRQEVLKGWNQRVEARPGPGGGSPKEMSTQEEGLQMSSSSSTTPSSRTSRKTCSISTSTS